MALYDLPLEQLRTYLPEREEPTDLDAFWSATLAEARRASAPPSFAPATGDGGLELHGLDVLDVTFSGFGGDPIKAWLLLPRGDDAPWPCVVEYLGYGRGRGHPLEWLTWGSLGYAHLVVDARGQGGQWSAGETLDPGPPDAPHYPGFLTRGIGDPADYYYRRLITDSVLAVDAIGAHPAVDDRRIVAAGGSQGGGLALAVAALHRSVAALLCDVPFMCAIRRGTEITDSHPYAEIAGYLRIHRTAVDSAFRTLAYFDGVNFAARGTAPALFSVGLMDTLCPPSTVFAAYNHYQGPKRISVWPYSGHEGGGVHQVVERVAFLGERWSR